MCSDVALKVLLKVEELAATYSFTPEPLDVFAVDMSASRIVSDTTKCLYEAVLLQVTASHEALFTFLTLEGQR